MSYLHLYQFLILAMYLYPVIWSKLVAERVPEILFSDTRNRPKNGFNASWTRLFFIFVCHIWWFSKFYSTFVTPTFKNHQIWQKWRRASFNLTLTHFTMVLRVPEIRSTTNHVYSWSQNSSIFNFILDFYWTQWEGKTGI